MFPRWEWLLNLLIWGAGAYALWVAFSAVLFFI